MERSVPLGWRSNYRSSVSPQCSRCFLQSVLCNSLEHLSPWLCKNSCSGSQGLPSIDASLKQPLRALKAANQDDLMLRPWKYIFASWPVALLFINLAGSKKLERAKSRRKLQETSQTNQVSILYLASFYTVQGNIFTKFKIWTNPWSCGKYFPTEQCCNDKKKRQLCQHRCQGVSAWHCAGVSYSCSGIRPSYHRSNITLYKDSTIFRAYLVPLHRSSTTNTGTSNPA